MNPTVELTYLDGGIIILTCILVMYGLFRGFFQAVLAFSGSVMGLVLGIAFARPLGNSISVIFDFENVLTGRILAFVCIYIGCWLSGILLGFLIRKILKTLRLGWIDRLLGGILGGIKSLVLCTVLMIVMQVSPSMKPTMDKSFILPRVNKAMMLVHQHFPESWKIYLSPKRWIGEYSGKTPKTDVKIPKSAPAPTPGKT